MPLSLSPPPPAAAVPVLLTMMMMLARTSLQRLARGAARQQRRWGSDMPKPQSMEAELWQGHSKKAEGWETCVYLTYSAAALCLVAVAMAPETSIQHWARAEAQARLDLPEGTVLEFGKHYNNSENLQAEWDGFYAKSVKPGEDDDDEDEDDEEEEEEEEDEE